MWECEKHNGHILLIQGFSDQCRLEIWNFIWITIILLFVIAGPILESKGMCVIFHKKGKKGQNIWKFGQKCTKFENILEKGSLMHLTTARMKQLEYALHCQMMTCKLVFFMI